MYSPIVFALSLVATLGLAVADGAPVLAVTVWSEADCKGTFNVEYIGTQRDYCFGSIGGNSISGIDGAVTYSGAECQGSYASWPTPLTEYQNVPFASVQLKCN